MRAFVEDARASLVAAGLSARGIARRWVHRGRNEAVLVSLLVFAGAVAGFRGHRAARLSSAETYATYSTYSQAQATLTLAAAGVAILAVLPIAAAVL